MASNNRTQAMCRIGQFAVVVFLFSPSQISISQIALVPSRNNSDTYERVPNLTPGDTCSKAMTLMGKPKSKDRFSTTWETGAMRIFAGFDSHCVLTSIVVEVKSKQRVLTPDGVILGKDTMNDVEQKLRARIMPDAESVDAPEGNWESKVALGSDERRRYTITYVSSSDPEIDAKLKRDPTFNDFRGKEVTVYELDLAAPMHTD